jgi:hypothetical protein
MARLCEPETPLLGLQSSLMRCIWFATVSLLSLRGLNLSTHTVEATDPRLYFSDTLNGSHSRSSGFSPKYHIKL